MNNPGLPEKQGLYDPQFEHDACGVGFVCQMKGKRTHEIIQQADGFTEAYQGSYQLLKDLEIIGSKNVDNIEDFLKKQVTWIDENRYKVCGKDDTPIQNLIDGIMETYFTVLYKLRFLK